MRRPMRQVDGQCLICMVDEAFERWNFGQHPLVEDACDLLVMFSDHGDHDFDGLHLYWSKTHDIEEVDILELWV